VNPTSGEPPTHEEDIDFKLFCFQYNAHFDIFNENNGKTNLFVESVELINYKLRQNLLGRSARMISY
jgi:hypothetical protein